MLSWGEASNQIGNVSSLTGDLSFLLLGWRAPLTDRPEDEIIRYQSYELKNAELYYSDKYFIHNICVVDRCFMCWLAYRRQLLSAHKPLAQLYPLCWMDPPRTMKTCACLRYRCPSSVPGPRCSTLVIPHSYCSTSSWILDISTHWPMLCCAFLLSCWSPAP
jgi:hypothetical protein